MQFRAESELTNLQTRLAAGASLGSHDLLAAVEQDLVNRRELSEGVLTKFMRHTAMSRGDLELLASRLQSEMSRVVSSDPDLLLNYSKVSVCVASELRRKAVALNLAA